MKYSIVRIGAISIFLLINCSMQIDAQNSRMVYKIIEKKLNHYIVMLKWYSQNLLNTEGVNLYRLEIPGGQIEKCNNSPILPLIDDQSELQRVDSSFLLFAELIRNKPEIVQEGFLQLHLFIKSFESNEIARLLGLFFTDSNIHSDKKYLYFVKKVHSGKETFLVQSDTISFPDHNSDKRIHSFSSRQRKNRIELKWQPMDSMFFSVNIYRKEISSWNYLKRNSEPIMISYFQDKEGNYHLPEIFFRDTFNYTEKEYFYYLTGIDFFGEESYISDTLKVIVRDSILPGIVKELKLATKDLAVHLSWKSPSDKDLRGFNLYRSYTFDSTFYKLNPEILPSGQNQFFDSVPETGSWYYKVSSLDSSGNESFSEKMYIEIHDLLPPAAPSGLELYEDSGKILVQWRKNKEKDVSGYLIYRLLVKNSELKPLLINSSPIKDTFYVDKNINCINEISYQVAAIDNSSNKSKFSNLSTIRLKDLSPPDQPYINSITATDTGILIQWLRNPENDLAFYLIHRFTYDFDTGQFKIGRNTESFNDRNVMGGKYYEYEILAVDSAFNSSRASRKAGISAVLERTRKICNAGILHAKYKKPYIKLDWSNMKDEKLLGYSIFRKDSVNTFTRLSMVLQKNEFIDKTVIKGKTYYYQLRSYYSDGNICISDPLLISIPIK